MTIDEAIKRCEDVENGKLCEGTVNHKACGSEHKQLGEWLEELKRMRAKFLTRKNVESLEDDEPECPRCGQSLNKWDEASYCHNCGQKLYRGTIQMKIYQRRNKQWEHQELKH